MAESGPGSDEVFVGQDLYSGGSFVYDPWVLYARGIITAPNLVLARIVGSGKLSLAKSLYTRSLPFGRRVYVPGDSKGEHTTLAETVLARGLTPLEHTAIDLALTATVAENEVPILPMVIDHILTPSHAPDGRLAEDGRLVGHALRRLVAGDLAGLFDGPLTVAFDPDLPMISLDLSRVTENSTLISVLMTCSSAWMESALPDPNCGQRWVIYDEARWLVSHPALLKRMDAHWRLARHYEIANMLIFQKLSDRDNVGDEGSATYTPEQTAASVLAHTSIDAPAHVTAETKLPRHQAGQVSMFSSYVEVRGFEPLTFSMPWRRATNCAIPPSTRPILKFQRSKRKTALKPNAQLDQIS